jgi:EmrB/QacA subfamily drug resistance transporter
MRVTADTVWDKLIWAIVIVLCGALFLDALDVSMIGIALPTIGTALNLSPSTLQWIVSGYVLGYGGFLLLGGRAADLLGRRRVFLIALGIFAVASLASAVVDNGSLLIAARVIKGIAAAFTAPAGLSLITTTFEEGPARNKAIGLYAATGAMGFSAGLVFGGFFTSIGWRYVFLMPAPIAIVLLLIGIRILPNPKEPAAEDGRRRSYDVAGAASITLAMLSLVYSVVEAPNRGWTDPLTLGGFVLCALLLCAFVVIEKRSCDPLVDLSIFKNHPVVHASLSGGLFFGSYLGFQFLATLYLQDAESWTPVEAALVFLPAGFILPMLASQTPGLIGRFGTVRLIGTAFLAFAIGYAFFLRAGDSPNYLTTLMPCIVPLGIGWGLGFPSMNVQATTGIPDEEQGLASGVFNTSAQIGGALVVAIVSAIISSHTTSDAGDPVHGVLDSLNAVTGVVIGIALLGAAISFVFYALSGRGTSDLPPHLVVEDAGDSVVRMPICR